MNSPLAPRAAALIAQLELQPHPEGGYYRELYRSPHRVQPDDGRAARPALTAIYFLLAAGQHSRWHRLRSDEVWQFLEGDPVELFVVDAGLSHCQGHVLGSADGTSAPQRVVRGLLAGGPINGRFHACRLHGRSRVRIFRLRTAGRLSRRSRHSPPAFPQCRRPVVAAWRVVVQFE